MVMKSNGLENYLETEQNASYRCSKRHRDACCRSCRQYFSFSCCSVLARLLDRGSLNGMSITFVFIEVREHSQEDMSAAASHVDKRSFFTEP